MLQFIDKVKIYKLTGRQVLVPGIRIQIQVEGAGKQRVCVA